MVAINFYFQVHQPFRLKEYTMFDIGKNSDYFDDIKNKEVMQKVSNKCYLPMNKLLLQLIKKYKNTKTPFKVSFSLTGVAIEQFELYAPEVLKSFKALAKTGMVEFLGETYHHSLSFLYSKKEFKEQVKMHDALIQKHFKQKPTVFRNTELIFNNEVAQVIEKMGYKAILAEGVDRILDWRSPNFVYGVKSTKKIKLLTKNYKLSDDIAFRFSNKDWVEHPLTMEKYAKWINAVNGNGEVINLFMDYETFGEHQWEHTGIFQFMQALPFELNKHPDCKFVTCSEAAKMFKARDVLDYTHLTSWADTERDLSAWLGNKIQSSSKQELYKIENQIKKTKNKKLVEDWRKLTTSDHFYYMCTKYFNDGDVHKYFNPFDSPYDSYISFMNILQDIKIRLQIPKQKTRIVKP